MSGKKPGSGRNYVRGRAKEYRARDALAARGYAVMRAAQSKGPADLLAGKRLPDGTVRVLAVQVKGGSARMEADDLERLVKFADAFGAEAAVQGAGGRWWRVAEFKTALFESVYGRWGVEPAPKGWP